jgi:hypothetical protein
VRRPGRFIRGPIQPDRWTALRFASLRWAALPVIDRRWTVPLAAIALAFGIFVGVAIGPSKGLGNQQMSTVVEVVPPPSDTTVASTNTPGGNGGDHANGGDASPPATTPPSDNGPFGEPAPPSSTPPISTPPPPVTTTPTTTTTTTPTDTPDDNNPPDTTPSTASVKGPVVHVNGFAGSYTVARGGGTLYSVHSTSLPNMGDVVAVEARALANGTWAETGDRSRTDGAEQADLTGTVTFSDPRIGAYTVSAAGSSILVRVKPGVRMPEVGNKVSVTARIANKLDPIEPVDAGRDGCGEPPKQPKQPDLSLEQVSLEVTDAVSTSDLEGIVQGVCRKSGTLIISADDLRESGRDVAIAVPNDLRLAKIDVGQVLKIRADIGSGGNLTAKKIADDQRESGADDETRIQPYQE